MIVTDVQVSKFSHSDKSVMTMISKYLLDGALVYKTMKTDNQVCTPYNWIHSTYINEGNKTCMVMHTFSSKFETTMLPSILHSRKLLINELLLVESQMLIRITTNMFRNYNDRSIVHSKTDHHKYAQMLSHVKLTGYFDDNLLNDFQACLSDFQGLQSAEYANLHNFLTELFKIAHSTKKYPSDVIESSDSIFQCTSHNYFCSEFPLLTHHTNAIKLDLILKEHLRNSGIDIFLINGVSELQMGNECLVNKICIFSHFVTRNSSDDKQQIMKKLSADYFKNS